MDSPSTIYHVFGFGAVNLSKTQAPYWKTVMIEVFTWYSCERQHNSLVNEHV